MNNALNNILRVAVNAPSGDNSQPWRFRIVGPSVEIFNVPDGDETLYNFRQRGSYLSHGALVENIVLLAAKAGYDSSVETFPDVPDCTARITFTQGISKDVPLADIISERTTNRKPYERRPLEETHRKFITAVELEPHVTIILAEQTEVIDTIALVISINERLLMENRQLHDFLFGMIRWTKEDELKRPGLYLKTMELPPPVQFMFRTLLRSWPVVRALNLIGLSRAIPKQSSQGYAASSAIGAIVLRGDSNTDFFNAGRVLERLWLTSNSLGVSLQPVTAIPYLGQRLKADEADAFTQTHKEYIRQANASLAKSLNLSAGEHVAMLFRIGYGDSPTARAHKREPIIKTA